MLFKGDFYVRSDKNCSLQIKLLICTVLKHVEIMFGFAIFKKILSLHKEKSQNHLLSDDSLRDILLLIFLNSPLTAHQTPVQCFVHGIMHVMIITLRMSFNVYSAKE